MATAPKTPGVYIEERSAFPNSVVEVPTGIPVFLGFTAKAERAGVSVLEQPVRITSLMEYEEIFGGAPPLRLTATGADILLPDDAPPYYLYHALRMFFTNGGGTCWIYSIGAYGSGDNGQNALMAAFEKDGALDKIDEPALTVIPDAVRLDRAAACEIYKQALLQGDRLQSRFVIMDVPGGYAKDDQNIDAFRVGLSEDSLSFGAAYYPWAHTNLLTIRDIRLEHCTPTLHTLLKDAMDADKPDADDPRLDEFNAVKEKIGAQDAKQDQVHSNALALSPSYAALMAKGLELLNRQPVAGAMAGVYARTDANVGVFKAPANTGVTTVVRPTVDISAGEQESLNAPPRGKAINAIRTFQGRGVLVWGARTLDANSLDWRYVNVRRTILMLEQSIKIAAEAYVFQPNTARTWTSVRGMISNFLNNQWKAGALAGATPAEAYNVAVGLNETMSSVDILEGVMRVRVLVAITRPAEFIVITFQQKMQTS